MYEIWNFRRVYDNCRAHRPTYVYAVVENIERNPWMPSYCEVTVGYHIFFDTAGSHLTEIVKTGKGIYNFGRQEIHWSLAQGSAGYREIDFVDTFYPGNDGVAMVTKGYLRGHDEACALFVKSDEIMGNPYEYLM